MAYCEFTPGSRDAFSAPQTTWAVITESGDHYHEKVESLPERSAQIDVHLGQYMKGFELVGLEVLFSSISAMNLATHSYMCSFSVFINQILRHNVVFFFLI